MLKSVFSIMEIWRDGTMRDIHILLTEEQYEQLLHMVAERMKKRKKPVTVSDVIREILDKYLEEVSE